MKWSKINVMFVLLQVFSGHDLPSEETIWIFNKEYTISKLECQT